MQSSKHWLQGCSRNSVGTSITKLIQSDIKETLIEIKNDVQGINSRMEEAKNQINNLEHKEKEKTFNQYSKT